MPGPRDDENADAERSGSRRPTPGGRGRQGAGRSGRDAKRPGSSSDRRSGGARKAGGGRDEEWKQGRGRAKPARSDADSPRPDRGPRPPIKGRRKTFDIDAAPNPRERERLDRSGDDREQTDDGERWVDDGPVRRAAGDAVRRGQRSGGAKSGNRSKQAQASPSGRNDKRRQERAAKRAETALEIDRGRLERMLGAAKAARVLSRLGEASDAYGEDRFEEARRVLKPLAETVPGEPAIRELYGLSLYRLGRWKLAVAELEEFARRTDSTEQHPVLADCYRALGQHARVEELWDELAMASPEAALVAEGRIVMAGSLADRGKLAEAIAVLEAGALGNKPLKYHHLRMRYALGDLYDRAGEQQSARRHFEMVAANEPDFFDVTDRLRQL